VIREDEDRHMEQKFHHAPVPHCDIQRCRQQPRNHLSEI
jgi:hypothetical protein